MKRIVSIMIAFAILTSMTTAFAKGSLSNFVTVNQYQDGKFTDVSSSAWYAENVKTAYELGIVNGNSATTFNPNGNILISETIAIASRIHSLYNTGKVDFEESTPWYQTYVDYAKENNIISGVYTYFNKATRTDFAEIMSKAIPKSELKAINNVEDDAIPDVKKKMDGSDSIYLLYRAGILTGSDSEGTFNPESNITRGEVSAIISRMIKPEQRKRITLKYVVSDTYKQIPLKTVTAVTGAECTSSYTGFDIQVNNGYIEGHSHYIYDDLYYDDYEKYFAPYIEYLETNPNFERFSSSGISMGGFMEEDYAYMMTDGSGRCISVTWDVPKSIATIDAEYSMRIWMFKYVNGVPTDLR